MDVNDFFSHKCNAARITTLIALILKTCINFGKATINVLIVTMLDFNPVLHRHILHIVQSAAVPELKLYDRLKKHLGVKRWQTWIKILPDRGEKLCIIYHLHQAKSRETKPIMVHKKSSSLRPWVGDYSPPPPHRGEREWELHSWGRFATDLLGIIYHNVVWYLGLMHHCPPRGGVWGGGGIRT